MEPTLMQSLKRFTELLTREAGALESLYQMEEQKYEVLRMVDADALIRLNSLEEEQLVVMELVEKKRKDALTVLAMQMGLGSDVTLSELVAGLSSEEEREKLAVLRDRIKHLTEKLQTAMRENRDMIQSNLEIINLTLNFANRNNQKEVYDYRSRKESRESIFLVNQLA